MATKIPTRPKLPQQWEITPDRAWTLLRIFKWSGISIGGAILLLGPPISWFLLATYDVGQPYAYFVVFYGIYAALGFLLFCLRLNDKSKKSTKRYPNKRDRDGYY